MSLSVSLHAYLKKEADWSDDLLGTVTERNVAPSRLLPSKAKKVVKARKKVMSLEERARVAKEKWMKMHSAAVSAGDNFKTAYEALEVEVKRSEAELAKILRRAQAEVVASQGDAKRPKIN